MSSVYEQDAAISNVFDEFMNNPEMSVEALAENLTQAPVVGVLDEAFEDVSVEMAYELDM
tara:strand:- start:10574 stop:10753 length:180 start_codon:yes stop_codon:yes gene_type:complete